MRVLGLHTYSNAVEQVVVAEGQLAASSHHVIV